MMALSLKGSRAVGVRENVGRISAFDIGL